MTDEALPRLKKSPRWIVLGRGAGYPLGVVRPRGDDEGWIWHSATLALLGAQAVRPYWRTGPGALLAQARNPPQNSPCQSILQ
jgi:hypothetical protein